MVTKQIVVVSGLSILASLVLVFTGASMASCGGTSSCAESACDSGGGAAGSGGSAGSGGGGSAGTGGSTPGGHQMVNGCDVTTAVDKRTELTVQITFAGTAYDPPCVRVMEGTNITFSGDFGTHPLVGGKVVGATPTPDSASPIPMTSSGMSAMATLTKAGDYGFYCSRHFASGMVGAVFVDAPRPPTSR